jgi:predicted HNH restriction endonuclease
MKSFKPRRRRATTAGAAAGAAKPSMESLLREVQTNRAARAHGYRERSLALHGWICGRCAREFEAETLHLLTVHHKDGNHDNNPPDGSNWENLCTYCHEAEHTKGVLGDYLTGRDRDR